MENLLVKIFGHIGTVLHGDAAVFDRWRWLRKNLRHGQLHTLDAGCGSGAFALYAAKIGNEVVGISFDERNNGVAQARAGILGFTDARFVTGDLRRLDEFASSLGEFDQIICFETIEHILGDRKLIKDLSDLLRPGGRLLLTTPYKHYSKRLLGDDKVPLSTHEDGGHVRWGYTHEELERIFNGAGLSVVRKDYVSGIISQLNIVLYRILQSKINYKIAWGLSFPFRILVVFDSLVTELIGFPHLSVAVVGEKKT
ncbi:MAG: class I SAM-dependent methyltransferase [Candidatus Brennerbacteria bacterium]|nr:class I SAM-dependent methyltransferase [Candidatus Brennerbacteria bacterium]